MDLDTQILLNQAELSIEVMKNIQLFIIPLMVIISASTRADPNEGSAAVKPGTEVRLKIDADPNEILVYIPTDYNDTSAWPVIFYYHGQGENLSTQRFQTATQGKSFIVVSMEFAPVPQGAMTQTQYLAYLRHELKNIAHAITALQGQLNIDTKAFVLAGVSRGGWLASDLFITRPGPWAAVAIMCAGYRGIPVRDRELPAGKFVYIGAGETDQNLSAAKKATVYFESHGADVVFDKYPGLGHAVDPDSPKLKEWFSVLREKSKPSPPVKKDDEVK